MARLAAVVVSAMWLTCAYADSEITVQLPNDARMEFVWIDPGTFAMGTTEEQKTLRQTKGLWSSRDEDSLPAHTVTIGSGFWLGKHEVRQDQWTAVMGSRPWEADTYVRPDAAMPASNISWYDAQVFVHALNLAAGDSLYRLPTEAEWEYACRAGTTTLYSFGDDESQLGKFAWNFYSSSWTLGRYCAEPVGGKLPNPWGLYDMHGNVLEWVQDWYGSYPSGSVADPQGPRSGTDRLLRGGAVSSNMAAQLSAQRTSVAPSEASSIVGFRLLRTGATATSATRQSWGALKQQVGH